MIAGWWAKLAGKGKNSEPSPRKQMPPCVETLLLSLPLGLLLRPSLLVLLGCLWRFRATCWKRLFESGPEKGGLCRRHNFAASVGWIRVEVRVGDTSDFHRAEMYRSPTGPRGTGERRQDSAPAGVVLCVAHEGYGGGLSARAGKIDVSGFSCLKRMRPGRTEDGVNISSGRWHLHRHLVVAGVTGRHGCARWLRHFETASYYRLVDGHKCVSLIL